MGDSEDQITIRQRGSDRQNEVTSNQNHEKQEVSTANGEATQPQGQQQPQQQDSPWKTIIWRILIFYLVWQFFRTKQPSTNNPNQQNPSACMNLFRKGDQLELSIFISEEPYVKNFSSNEYLFWKETDIIYGNWYDGPNKDGSRDVHGEIKVSERVQNNGSLYMHVFMVKGGYSLDPNSEYYSQSAVVNKTRMMTLYKRRRIHKTKNLLTGESNASPDMVKASNVDNKTELISYWHPNLTINILDDQTQWVRGSLPAPINEYIIFDNESNFYYPVLYLNDYWNYASDFMPINDTTKTLELHLTYQPISLFKWQMYVSQQMRSQWSAMLGDTQEHTDEEQDMLKRTLRETNPYLLGLTIVVSLVHSVFEFLAFKNDIQFWKSRKSLEGLSVRSVFFNVFQSVIVVLFVLDNETNMVVVISCCVGLLIELWKITKVVDIKVDRTRSWGPFPRIMIQDKSSYKESPTKEYDMLAFKYLSWLLFPLLGCYAVYSMLYNEHKGWYSFVLSIMYGFLLTFGFIMMTPQLFINYKLKSVAHLPWRMLTYKALNTFIDDIFAFVIKMPTLYRIGCLRDDVIFFIYVYQRYIYPIDPKRINEFGTSGETDETNKPIEEPTQDSVQPVENGQVAEPEENKKDK